MFEILFVVCESWLLVENCFIVFMSLIEIELRCFGECVVKVGINSNLEVWCEVFGLFIVVVEYFFLCFLNLEGVGIYV